VPEQQQVANDPSSWEARYKETQAELTRKAQQLAEIERQKAEGQLVEKASYDEWLVKWASENPEQALEVFPSLKQYASSSGGDASGGTARPGGSSTAALDDAIFDQSSEAHQKFVQEHGQKGYRQALMSRMAPELLETTGLGKELTELREFKQSLQGELESLRERVAQSEKYSTSAFDQVQIAQDPRRKQIREIQEKLRADPNNWYDIVERLNKADAGATATPPPAAPAAAAQPPQAPTPEQLADRISQASVVPQGAGSGSGGVPSQALDPFDAAVAKADPALAQRLGIPTAA
jgi:hypothetical protein